MEPLSTPPGTSTLPPSTSPPLADATGPEGSPPRPPPAWWLLVLFLSITLPLTFLAGPLTAALTGRTRFLPAELLVSQLSYLLPALAWARLSGYRPSRLLRLTRSPGVGLLLGAATGVGVILAGASLMSIWRSLLPASVLARFDLAHELSSQGLSPWLLLLLASLLPALCEELAFHGALQTALLHGRSPFRAIWGAAVIFAAMHFDPVRFPGVLLVGFALGWLTWRTGSIWPAVTAHAINNGAAVISLVTATAEELAAPADSMATPAALALLAAGLGGLWLVAAAARRWLPTAPDAASFLIPREAASGGATPPPATTAGAAPSPSGTGPP